MGEVPSRDAMRHGRLRKLTGKHPRLPGGRKEAVRGSREVARRAVLAASLRRTDDRVAGGDKIVDDDRDLALDVADQRIAGQDAAAKCATNSGAASRCSVPQRNAFWNAARLCTSSVTTPSVPTASNICAT
jgi:hypothetical protein